jgi:type VI protein secretion system component Hcp
MKSLRTILFTVVLAACTGTASAAVYLTVEPADRAASDSKHQGWVQLQSFSPPIYHPHSSAKSGGRVDAVTVGAPRPGFVSLGELVDALAQNRAVGQASVRAVSTVINPEGEEVVAYEWTLENVRVTSFQVSGAGADAGAVPTEQLTLNFEEIKWEY